MSKCTVSRAGNELMSSAIDYHFLGNYKKYHFLGNWVIHARMRAVIVAACICIIIIIIIITIIYVHVPPFHMHTRTCCTIDGQKTIIGMDAQKSCFPNRIIRSNRKVST